ncbi:MAG: hypothetical protein GX938_03250 [Spirochaetales bacterium]|nr:hypothetical protein [Spirochaetales bacterium]
MVNKTTAFLQTQKTVIADGLLRCVEERGELISCSCADSFSISFFAYAWQFYAAYAFFHKAL